jgi:photosystem II stability/assembly factor-like uncharacterized protein
MNKAGLVLLLGVCAAALFAAGSAGPAGLERSGQIVGAGPWAELGPMGGDIRGIVRNPKAPAELYAVTYSGFVYRSGNNGASWARKAALGTDIYDIAIDPKSPSTLYVLGGSSIFKSVNKGVTFAEVRLPDYSYVWEGRLAINPSNPQILFISGSFIYDTTNWKRGPAVLKSANGGQAWTVKKLDTTAKYASGNDIVVSPKNPSLVFACGYYTPSSGTGAKAYIYRSTNSGETWKSVTPAFLTSTTYTYAYALAVDPTSANRAYVAYGDGVARTSNGGTSWEKQSSPTWMRGYTLTVDKSAPATVYSGSYNSIYRSSDGGRNWTQLSDGAYGSATRMLVLGKTVHFASSAGIFKSVNGGSSFGLGHKGILAADIKSFVRLPAGGGSLTGGTGTFYAAAAGYGLFKSADGCATWTKLKDFLGSDAIHRVVAPRSDPRRVYVSTYG